MLPDRDPSAERPRGKVLICYTAHHGDCAMWWREGGCGYTCRFDDAGRFDPDDPVVKRLTRPEDRVIPVEAMEPRAVRVVGTDAVNAWMRDN